MNIATVIPVYNEELIIETFLRQFLYQDLPTNEFSIIIVNNNSTDKTVDIVKKFAQKHPDFTIIIINEITQGIPAARKKGYDTAVKMKSDIILSFDSDTQIPNNILSYVKQQFEQKNIDYLIGNQIFPPQTMLDMILEIPELIKYDKSFYILEEKYFGERFFGPYSAITTKFYKQIPYDINNSLVPYEDVLLSRRCFYCGGKYFKSEIRVITSDRRIHSNIVSWLTRNRIPTKNIIKNNKKKSYALTSKETEYIYEKRLETGIENLVATYVDAIRFAKENPKFSKIPLNIAKNVTDEIFCGNLSFYTDIIEKYKNEPLTAKKIIIDNERLHLEKKLRKK